MSRIGKKRKERILTNKHDMMEVLKKHGFEEEPTEFCCEGPCGHEQNNPFRWMKGDYSVEFGGGVGRVTDWQIYDSVYFNEGSGHGFYAHGKGSDELHVALCELPDEKGKASE